QWLVGWKRKGWVNSARKPVKNKDLWQELDAQVQKHKISWHWVKGHSGNVGNDRADALANQGVLTAS
ncbi:MAG: RNase H family protein, partial [Natronospirillum sp.]